MKHGSQPFERALVTPLQKFRQVTPLWPPFSTTGSRCGNIALWRWADSIESANRRKPSDLKATFRSASFVGDLTVFNVGGNKYRVAAFVHYRKQIVYIKRIGTHQEYDKWDL